ncbi:MAG: hypothetical protein MJK15_22635 [Colwellia sp.]|nr:hypothetical protein [Colwellia sp.]
MLLVYFIGSCGTCWVIFGGDIEALLAFSLNWGDALFLAGCISMVFFSISLKLLYRGDELLVIVFCTLLCGAGWMLLALLILDQPLNWGLLDVDLWLHMGYLSIFTTLASTFIIQKTTLVLGPVKVMAYIYLSPAFVAFIMLFIEGKSIDYIIFPGMFLSLIATMVLQLQDRHKAIH